jgi:D-alanine transaminase
MADQIVKQIAYLNGQWTPLKECVISTQDRGFLFGDGVYEVIPVYQRTIFEFDAHLQRLKNSLSATRIANPLDDQGWLKLCNDLIKRHPWEDQYLYLQVTRGVQMHRDHLPDPDIEPTVYAYTNALKPLPEALLQQGIKVITLEDIRWLRCDIKAITLLPNVMRKLAAKEAGVDDAILIARDGTISEGTASNVFIVKEGTLFTPPTGSKLLPGITRQVIEAIANAQSIPLKEQELFPSDLDEADEIWLSSSTKEALPVTELNGKPVGNGQPGAVWQTLRQHYQSFKKAYIEKHRHDG